MLPNQINLASLFSYAFYRNLNIVKGCGGDSKSNTFHLNTALDRTFREILTLEFEELEVNVAEFIQQMQNLVRYQSKSHSARTAEFCRVEQLADVTETVGERSEREVR